MKHLLLFVAAFSLLTALSAQPALQILDENSNDVTGKTITVYSSDPLCYLQESHFKVRNSGDTDLKVFLRRVNNTVVPNSSNSFCFGVNCYPPSTDTSQVVTRIGVGEIDESFVGDYSPGGGKGISSVTYEFFDNTTSATKVAASVTVFYAVAEVLDLFDGAGNRVNGSVISVVSSDTSAAAYLDTKVKVRNNTSVEIFTYARRIQNSVVPGTSNTFCYGVCYPPFVDTSTVVVNIPAGAVDSNFVADYTPAKNAGTTSLTYEFYDNFTFGEPLVARVTIEFTLSGVGMRENTLPRYNVAYPNPASGFTTFEYELPANTHNAFVTLRNVTGTEISQVSLDLSSGKVVLNTAEVPSGIYLYSLVIDSRVVFTKKLIVRH